MACETSVSVCNNIPATVSILLLIKCQNTSSYSLPCVLRIRHLFPVAGVVDFITFTTVLNFLANYHLLGKKVLVISPIFPQILNVRFSSFSISSLQFSVPRSLWNISYSRNNADIEWCLQLISCIFLMLCWCK
jgi:hypothetical protein